MNEKEINLAIYNKLADIAREVFNHLTAEPGRVYTPADIAHAITRRGLTWAEDYDPATVYEVAEGSFACSVNGWGIFHVLDRVARAWSIATAARVKFITERAAAPVVASFTLTAAEGRELLACCADDQLRPAMCYVHLDTRRRVLVASDGYIMRVINLGDRLTITDTAATTYYNIHKSVIKAGRAVTITADNYATAAGVSVACFADIYPNWAQVLNGCRSYCEAGRVALPPATWRELKKAVAYVAKVLHQSKNAPLRVTIAHTQGENVLHIYARDIDYERERETAVAIDPAAPSFSIDTDARRLAKVTTAAALYVADTCRPIITTDPAGLAMIMPLQPLEGDKYYKPFTIAPAGQTLDPLPGVDVAAAAADITAAPAADSEADTPTADSASDTPAEVAAPAADLAAESEAETTAAAPAADSEADTPTAETIESDTPAEVAAPAADSEAGTLPLLTIATADSQTADRAERRPLLLTVARYALRLAAAAALLLLLTIAPDRAADTLAAPAADSEADTITAAELLTADSEAESRAEVAAPADSPRPTAERRHAPANKRESHTRALPTIATADSIAAPAADSIAAPLLTIEADTLTADTLTAAPAADLTADTPTDDTDSKADTITTDEPTDDTDPAAADSKTDSTPTDTAAAPCSPSAPVAPIVIVCFGI